MKQPEVRVSSRTHNLSLLCPVHNIVEPARLAKTKDETYWLLNCGEKREVAYAENDENQEFPKAKTLPLKAGRVSFEGFTGKTVDKTTSKLFPLNNEK